MTSASPKIDSIRGKKTVLRRSLRKALAQRFSLLYLDLIMTPAPEDL